MRNLEILAPAGDMQSLKCAVYNGADAVYLGLNNFNARIKADNFNKENIFEVVKFAHLYNCKVYVTINTLVKDSEVKDFVSLVKICIDANVDAFIIQDFGMANLLKSIFPDIVLHASTQMGIHNLKGAKLLENLGFCRVVLSRETKLKDIIEIKKNTNLEIEYFVQGALCVAFSGNCYLSAIKNGNSGNRGKCLQLCRLPYTLSNNGKNFGDGYFLSCKDLCLIKNLKTLIDAGVTSFKIEGRLKRASYVAQTVRSYKKALESAISNNLFNIEKEKSKIQEIFSRGEFNEEAYLYNNFDIINYNINNHEGKLIGKVEKVEKFKDLFKITIKSSEIIGFGDAIRLVNRDYIQSIGVGNVNELGNGKYEIFSTKKPIINSDIYLLKSVKKEENLISYVKKLPITFNFIAKIGAKAKLTAIYKDVSVSVESENLIEQAKSKACSFDDVYKQLSKLNDTNFYLDSTKFEIDDIFVAVSVLNDLRRRVIVLLENKILERFEHTKNKKFDNYDLTIPKLNTPKQNLVIVDSVKNLSVYPDYDVIIAPKNYLVEEVSKLIDDVKKFGYSNNSIYLELPIVTTSEECKIIDEIVNKTDVGLVVNNYSQLEYAKTKNVIAGIGLNVYNSFTAKALVDMGVKNFIKSIEGDNFITNSGLTYAVGYPPLIMTLCHCPVKAIIGGDCGKCRYNDNIVLIDEKKNKYVYRRIRIINCYFQLISKEKFERKIVNNKIIDLREI